ncbi:hypothetical protein [Staphylococcus simulans]
MKSKQVWNYSQKEFKIVFIKMQFILLFIGNVWLIYDILNFPKGNSCIAQAVVYFISVIIVIIMTEIKVKKFAKNNYRLSKYTILLLVPYVLLFFISTQNIFPGNPVKEKTSKIGKHLYEFFPQGWAFYSKSPRGIYI